MSSGVEAKGDPTSERRVAVYDEEQQPALSQAAAMREISKLRYLVTSYEEKNQKLATKNSRLEVKLIDATSDLTLNDSDAMREMKETKLQLREAKRQLAEVADQTRVLEKTRALEKYWQREAETSEAARLEDKRKFRRMLVKRDDEIEMRDKRLKEVREQFEFQKERADVLDEKLLVAEDKCDVLGKKNAELEQRMRDLANACKLKMVDMQKSCDMQIKRFIHECKTRLKTVRKYAEKQCAMIVARVHVHVGKKMTHMDKLVPLLISKLDGIKGFYHNMLIKNRKEFEKKEREYIYKILGAQEALSANNKRMDKMGFELEEMTRKADSVWSHLRAVLHIREMELKIEELGNVITSLKGKITRQGRKLERTEMARLEALDTITVRDQQLVQAEDRYAVMRTARRTLMYMIPKLIEPRDKRIRELEAQIPVIREAAYEPLRRERVKILALEDKIEALQRSIYIKTQIVKERGLELDRRARDISVLVAKQVIDAAVARSEIARLEAIIVQKNKEIAQLKVELARMTALAKKYKANWEDAEERCRQREQTILIRNAEIKRLKARLAQTISAAKGEETRLNGIIVDKKAVIVTRDNTIEVLERKLTKMTAKAKDLGERLDVAVHDNSIKTNKIMLLNAKAGRLETRVAQLEKKVVRQAETIDEWRAKHRDMTLAYETQVAKVKSLETDKVHIARRADQMRVQLAKLEKSKVQLKRDYDEHKIEYREFIEESKEREEALREELEHTKEDYDIWIADLQDQIGKLKDHIQTVQDARRKLTQSLRAAEQKAEELRRATVARLDEKGQELVKLQMELRESKRKIIQVLKADRFISLQKYARFMFVEERDKKIATAEKKVKKDLEYMSTERKASRETVDSLSKRVALLTDIIRQLLEQLTATDQTIQRVIFSKKIEEKSEKVLKEEVNLLKTLKLATRKPSPARSVDPPQNPAKSARGSGAPYKLPLGQTFSSMQKMRGVTPRRPSTTRSASVGRQSAERREIPGSSRVPSVKKPPRRRGTPSASARRAGRLTDRSVRGGSSARKSTKKDRVLMVAWGTPRGGRSIRSGSVESSRENLSGEDNKRGANQ